MGSAADFFIIVNPASGRGRGARTSSAVARLLRAAGRRVEVVETTAAGDAARIAEEVASRDVDRPKTLVACGGDGCIQEVAGSLARARENGLKDGPLLGLAPAGRCNDFARAMGVAANPMSIMETLRDGKPLEVDLGRCNDRIFCTVATVGVDAEVSRYVDTMRMPLRGAPAYLYGAVQVLLRYRAQLIRVTGEFGTIEQPLLIASCANTSSYGGAIRIAPGAVPTDGLLDLCLIEDVSKLRLLTLLPAVIFGTHPSAAEVRLIRTQQVTIDADVQRPIWADGEAIGTTPANIQIIPSALTILAPTPAPSPV
jgi:diacylglycerol kinase (ATP)